MTMILSGTNGGTFPTWTTAGRPASPAVGQFGYNTTTGLFDMYTASGWVSSLTSAAQSVPKAALPTGSVLQVVQATTSTEVTTSSSSYIDTGLTGSITPSSATSKILVMVSHGTNTKSSASANNRIFMRITRDGTSIAAFGNGLLYTATAVLGRGSISFSYLDSPATTSAVTYKTQFNNPDGGADVQVQTNSSPSSIILMEIAA